MNDSLTGNPNFPFTPNSTPQQPASVGPAAPWFQPAPGHPSPVPPAAPYPPVGPDWPANPVPFPPQAPVRPPLHSSLQPRPQGAHDDALRETVQAFVAADKKKRRSKKSAQTDKSPRTRVFFVLDASGSMLSGKELTLAGYNQQVDIVREEAANAGQTQVSLLVFNEEVKTLYAHQDVARLEHLSAKTYRPGGSTALIDALGAAIRQALAAPDIADKSTAVLIALFTDGEENASQLHTGPALSECVKLLQDTGRFTFTLMGPKEHLNDLASLLSIARGNIAGFDASSLSDRGRAMHTMAAATASYMALRSAGIACSANLYAGDTGAPKAETVGPSAPKDS